MNEELYNYFIHYNPYQSLFFLVPRDKVTEYLNGDWKKSETYPSAKSIDALIDDFQDSLIIESVIAK